MIEPGFSAEGCVSEMECGVGFSFNFFEYVYGLNHDFGADSVSFEYGDNFGVGHGDSLACARGWGWA